MPETELPLLRRPSGGEPAAAPAARRPTGDPRGSLKIRIQGECPVGEAFDLTLAPGDGGPAPPKRLARIEMTWENLRPGVYTLAVDGRGFEPLDREVTVRAGADAVALVTPVPRNRVRGRVVDARTGDPVAGSSFEVETRTAELVPFGMSFHGSGAADGRFCMVGIPWVGDEMRVHVTAEGYEARASDWFPIGAYVDDLVLDLTSTDLAVGFVQGRVTSGEEGTDVVDADLLLVESDVPLESVFVLGGYLRAGGGLATDEDPGSERNRGRSEQDGAFRVEANAPFSGRLVVFHPGYRMAESRPIQLRAGEVEHVEIQLERGAFIRGKVISSPELPERPARLDIVGPDRPYVMSVRDDGTFELGGLEDGVYGVHLHVFRENTKGVETVVPGPSEIAVIEGGADVEVILHLGSGLGGTSLEGDVRLPEDEKITEWAIGVVDRRQPARGMITTTGPDAGGHFVLRDVPDGDLLLAAVGRSLDGTRQTMSLHPIAVRGGVGPSGLFVDASGPRVEFSHPAYRPTVPPGAVRLSFVEVELFDGFPAREQTLYLDQDGVAVIYGLPAGRYEARLDLAEGEYGAVFVVPASPGSAQIVLFDKQ